MFLSYHRTRVEFGRVGGVQQWGFAPSRGNLFYRLEVSVPYQQGRIEIVYGRTNVPGEKVKEFAQVQSIQPFHSQR